MLNKESLRGTGKVFSFTLAQFMKTKSNIVSLIILFIFTLASVPIGTLVSGGSVKGAEKTSVSAVYINNETPFEILQDSIISAIGDSTYFTPDIFIPSTAGMEPGPNEVTVTVYGEADGSFSVSADVSPDTIIDVSDLSAVMDTVSAAFDLSHYKALGISPEQAGTLTAGLDVNIMSVSDYLDSDTGSWESQYTVQLIYSVVVMMISIFAVSYIARSVVEEKASKLVELLMVSIKPLALIVGKILAAMVYVFLMLVVMLSGALISYFVTGIFLDVASFTDYLATMGISAATLNIGPLTVVTVIVSLLLGYLTFSIISGVTAAGCSVQEDLQSATMGSTFVIMACYMVAIITGSMASDFPTISYVTSLLPFVSVFCAPAQYIVGNIGFGIVVISWIVQAIVIILLSIFCARIYQSLLMYRGERIKLTRMFSMMRETKKGKENG